MDRKKIKKYIPRPLLDLYSRVSGKILRIIADRRHVRTIDAYNSRLPEKVALVAAKDRIKVVFYVLNLGMWKSDRLFRLLRQDSRFSPVIVPYLHEKDSPEYNREMALSLRQYFLDMGYPYEEGFDLQTNRQIPVDSLGADIVFYPQPYINDMASLPSKALMGYIPYSFSMSDLPELHDFLYQNICWRMFYPSQLHKDMEARYSYNKGVNVVVTGNPAADYFLEPHEVDSSMWKQQDPRIKRIIWAPHHSIWKNDSLDIATFLDIAQGMLELAGKYEGRVQFVFKPHPRLEAKLYHAVGWGVEKTRAYYDQWRNRPNCNLVDGNYVDLFLSSDAMVHDCGTFIADYLYVNKPVLFLSDKPCIERFNEFANACYKVHYHGSSLGRIEEFIQMVLSGEDEMLPQRTRFIEDNLSNPDGTTVAMRTYIEICRGLGLEPENTDSK